MRCRSWCSAVFAIFVVWCSVRTEPWWCRRNVVLVPVIKVCQWHLYFDLWCCHWCAPPMQTFKCQNVAIARSTLDPEADSTICEDLFYVEKFLCYYLFFLLDECPYCIETSYLKWNVWYHISRYNAFLQPFLQKKIECYVLGLQTVFYDAFAYSSSCFA